MLRPIQDELAEELNRAV